MHGQYFEDIFERILATHEYPLFLMATFHTHKVERSELLQSKIVLYLTGGYLACATTDASWQQPMVYMFSFNELVVLPNHLSLPLLANCPTLHMVELQWSQLLAKTS